MYSSSLGSLNGLRTARRTSNPPCWTIYRHFSLSWVPDSVLRPDRSASHWVSIILCSDRDQTKVEFATAGLDNQLFVSRYLVALPSAEELREFIQRDREAIENSMREAHG
jgi:hypothetical protein